MTGTGFDGRQEVEELPEGDSASAVHVGGAEQVVDFVFGPADVDDEFGEHRKGQEVRWKSHQEEFFVEGFLSWEKLMAGEKLSKKENYQRDLSPKRRLSARKCCFYR